MSSGASSPRETDSPRPEHKAFVSAFLAEGFCFLPVLWPPSGVLCWGSPGEVSVSEQAQASCVLETNLMQRNKCHFLRRAFAWGGCVPTCHAPPFTCSPFPDGTGAHLITPQ